MGKPGSKIPYSNQFTRVFLVAHVGFVVFLQQFHGETRCEVEAAENLLGLNCQDVNRLQRKKLDQSAVCMYIHYIYIICTCVCIYIYIYLHVDMYDWVLKRGTSNWHKLGIAMLPKMTRSAATKPVP